MSEILVDESKLDWTNRVAVAVDAVEAVISALPADKKSKSKQSAKAAAAAQPSQLPPISEQIQFVAAIPESDDVVRMVLGPLGGLCDLIAEDDEVVNDIESDIEEGGLTSTHYPFFME